MSHQASGIRLGVVMILGLACAAISAIAMVFYRPVHGYAVNVVLSGSMRPSIQPGGLVITWKEGLEGYRIGTVVTFHVPKNPSLIVTHRITKRYLNSYGIMLMNTKGDANRAEDDWSIMSGNIIGRQAGYVPYVGYVIQALKSRLGFLVFALAFFVFFVSQELINIGRFLTRKEAYAAHGKTATYGD
jgi:signal peptidase I